MESRERQSLTALSRILDRLPNEISFKLHNAWHLTVAPNWRIPCRRNDDYSLIYIRDGTGSYTIDGTEYAMEPGRIILLSPEMTYFAEQNPINPPRLTSFRFGAYESGSGSPFLPEPFYLVFSDKGLAGGEGFLPAFTRLYHQAAADPYPYQPAACGAALASLLIFIYSVLSTETRQPHDPRITKARIFIDQTVTRHVTLKELAECAGLSPKYFSKLFHSQYGKTPQQYILYARMRYGKYLLEETGESVRSVALALGYGDPYIFSKLFKQVYGYSPGAVTRQKYRDLC